MVGPQTEESAGDAGRAMLESPGLTSGSDTAQHENEQLNSEEKKKRKQSGTGPRSTAASCRRWSECSRGRTTPMLSFERTWPAGSTSQRPECRFGSRTDGRSFAVTSGPCWPARMPHCSNPTQET
ncbi:hypothetical protein SRHO_G00070090 [Serrasalmus rhombeus]